VKTASEMTYIVTVSSGALNSTQAKPNLAEVEFFAPSPLANGSGEHCKPILRSPSRLFCYATKVKSSTDDSKGLTLTPLEGQKLCEQARRAYILLLVV